MNYKLNWNFLGGEGGVQNKKPFRGGGGSMDNFWNCTLLNILPGGIWSRIILERHNWIFALSINP